MNISYITYSLDINSRNNNIKDFYISLIEDFVKNIQ